MLSYNLVMAISKEEQIITVFLHRFNRFFMPTLLQLKRKVDNGDELTSYEISFFEQVLTATRDILPKIITNQKYRGIFVGAIHYYSSITKQALINAENRKNQPSQSTKGE